MHTTIYSYVYRTQSLAPRKHMFATLFGMAVGGDVGAVDQSLQVSPPPSPPPSLQQVSQQVSQQVPQQVPQQVSQQVPQQVPQHAQENTQERFSAILDTVLAQNDVFFYKEIRRAALEGGMGNLSVANIDMYVWNLHSLKPYMPSKIVDGKKKQDRGFKYIPCGCHGEPLQAGQRPRPAHKHARIRSFVSSGLRRIGCTKNAKTLKYLGVDSFDTVTQHIQHKMDCYNTQHPDGAQMTFDNIELDHIKPVQRFASEMNHYTNLQPLLAAVNRSKSDKWTPEDESFWRANIQFQPGFSDIYQGAAVSTGPLDTLVAAVKSAQPEAAPTNHKAIQGCPPQERYAMKKRKYKTMLAMHFGIRCEAS